MNPQQPAPPAPQPAAPVNDPSSPPPFSLGTPGEQPQPPAPAPVAEEMPTWAQDFVNQVNNKLTSFEGALTAEPEPAAPIGATESELAKLNPQKWDQVDEYVQGKIQQGVEQGIQNFTQSIQEQNAQAQAATEQVNGELDAQVADLERTGLIPAITNPNDRNDSGRIARRELYGAAAKLGTTDLRSVATTVIPAWRQQGKMYDPMSDSLIDYSPAIPGAQAPIGSSTATTGMNSNAPTYGDIHKARSFDELRARAGL